MATILEFRAASAPHANGRDAAAPGRGAELIFFPGVRYERHQDDAGTTPVDRTPDASRPRSRRKIRDTIELDD